MGGPVGCPRGRRRREAGHGVSLLPCVARALAAARGSRPDISEWREIRSVVDYQPTVSRSSGFLTFLTAAALKRCHETADILRYLQLMAVELSKTVL